MNHLLQHPVALMCLRSIPETVDQRFLEMLYVAQPPVPSCPATLAPLAYEPVTPVSIVLFRQSHEEATFHGYLRTLLQMKARWIEIHAPWGERTDQDHTTYALSRVLTPSSKVLAWSHQTILHRSNILVTLPRIVVPPPEKLLVYINNKWKQSKPKQPHCTTVLELQIRK